MEFNSSRSNFSYSFHDQLPKSPYFIIVILQGNLVPRTVGTWRLYRQVPTVIASEKDQKLAKLGFWLGAMLVDQILWCRAVSPKKCWRGTRQALVISSGMTMTDHPAVYLARTCSHVLYSLVEIQKNLYKLVHVTAMTLLFSMCRIRSADDMRMIGR